MLQQPLHLQQSQEVSNRFLLFQVSYHHQYPKWYLKLQFHITPPWNFHQGWKKYWWRIATLFPLEPSERLLLWFDQTYIESIYLRILDLPLVNSLRCLKICFILERHPRYLIVHLLFESRAILFCPIRSRKVFHFRSPWLLDRGLSFLFLVLLDLSLLFSFLRQLDLLQVDLGPRIPLLGIQFKCWVQFFFFPPLDSIRQL